jgi:hypothetical protein
MELEYCANEEPSNDDVTEPYFADNDDGPTDIDNKSSTIIASSHGSSVGNSNYIHFKPSISHHIAASIITNIMRPLTADENQRYTKALHGKGGDNNVMVACDGSKLSRKIIQRLKPATWLNDKLINFHNKIILSELDEKLCKAIPGRKRCFFSVLISSQP